MLILTLVCFTPCTRASIKKSHTQQVALKGKILKNIDHTDIKSTYIFKSGSRVFVISNKLHDYIEDDFGRNVTL